MRNIILCMMPMILGFSCSLEDQEAIKELTQALILLGTFSGMLPAILIILLIYGIKALVSIDAKPAPKPYDPQRAKHRKWEALLEVPEEDRDSTVS